MIRTFAVALALGIAALGFGRGAGLHRRAARRLQDRLRGLLQGHHAGWRPRARLPRKAQRQAFRGLQEGSRRGEEV